MFFRKYGNIESISFFGKERVTKNNTLAPNKYPVFLRFIVKDTQKDKFDNLLYSLVEKYDINNSYKILSITPDIHGADEKTIILRLDVTNNNKKDAEKYLLFCQEVFVKLGLDFYPSYTEAPIIRKR